jgi:S-adenosylmethionine-diacylglycerol 3-amino-3-carboxypropyl transferase
MVRTWSDRFHQCVFDGLYRRSLLYNACWEDPACDRVALRLGADDRVLVITSGGCNALDYALCGPREVVAVDANPRQSALLALKLAAINCLDFPDFFLLFGAGRHPGAVLLYRSRLRAALPPWARPFWDRRIGWFLGRHGDSFYFHGLAGAFARLLHAYLRLRPGLGEAFQRLLGARDLDTQRCIYDQEVAPRLWTPLLAWAVSRQAAMSLLGVPPAQTREVALQHDADAPAERSVAGFVRACVERVFRQLPLGGNYFWTCYLRGGYTADCCPEYLKPANFAALKNGLAQRVTVRTDTVAGLLAAEGRPFTRFVLLDHLDWMGAHRPAELDEEWRLILARAKPGARAIFRSARAEPLWLSQATVSGPNGRVPVRTRLRFDQALAGELHARDRVGTYGGFHIADLES